MDELYHLLIGFGLTVWLLLMVHLSVGIATRAFYRNRLRVILSMHREINDGEEKQEVPVRKHN
jgi:hypothetical protein